MKQKSFAHLNTLHLLPVSVLRCGDIPAEITLTDPNLTLFYAPWIPGTNFSYETCLNGSVRLPWSDLTIRCIVDEETNNPVWSYGCYTGWNTYI